MSRPKGNEQTQWVPSKIGWESTDGKYTLRPEEIKPFPGHKCWIMVIRDSESGEVKATGGDQLEARNKLSAYLLAGNPPTHAPEAQKPPRKRAKAGNTSDTSGHPSGS